MKKHILTIALFICTTIAFSQGLSLPYYTGYDSPSEIAGWQQFRTGFMSTYSWGVGGGGFSASCLAHDYNVGGNQSDTVVDWYVSPPLNFTAPGKIAVKVQTQGFSTPLPDNCEIWFGTGSPDPSIGNWTLVGNLSYMLPQFTWLDTTISIPFTSDSGYVAFKYKTIGAAWCVYNIDNVTVSLDSSVAVYESSDENKSFDIYPNPLTNTTRIYLGENVSKASIDISMFDINGKVVEKFSTINKSVFQIDRNNLPTGIYFVRLSDGEKIIGCKKLVVK